MIKCEIDGKEFKNGGVLARYLKKQYSLTYKEYYHKYILKSDKIPTCKCGCTEELTWTSVGYRDYKGKHEAKLRLKINNPFTSKKSKDKSAETRRRQFANGERTIWCKGLTKNTDIRVKKMGECVSKAFTDERKEKMSILMSKNRLNGTTPTLFGPESSRWKGGTSEINNIVRSNKRLYDEWKYPILIKDGFKCVECGNIHKLHIHHDKEKFCEIVEKHMPDVDTIVDFELKKSIAEKIVDYHIKNKVSGITLCEKCHQKYHPSLNFS